MRETLTVKYDSDTDDYYLEFPDELMEKVGWKVGDTISWSKHENGSWILTKKEEVVEASDQTPNASTDGTPS